MSSILDQKRQQDLEDNIRETLKLIKEYEDKLRLSDDPKERRRCQVEIEKFNAEIAKYQQELETLGEPNKTIAITDQDHLATTREKTIESISLELDLATLIQICGRHLDKQIQELAAKYVSRLYVAREALEEEFKRFMEQSEKTCFLVLGKSGSGKTNSLCRLAEKYSKSMPVIFLRGTLRIDRPNTILERIVEIIGLGIGQPVNLVDMLRSVDTCMTANNTYLLIFIDGINESSDIADLKEELHTTLQICSGRRIRYCFSCRDLLWSHFVDDFWTQYVYTKLDLETTAKPQLSKTSSVPRGPTTLDSQEEAKLGGSSIKGRELGIRLEDFSETELGIAIEKYFSEYQIKANIIERARQRCRHPLLLRIFSEANRGESFGILREVGYLSLMEAYWDVIVWNIQKQLHFANTLEIEALILAIAAKMLTQKSSLLSEEEMQEVTLAQNISLESPLFVALLDEGILLPEESSSVTRQWRCGFSFEEFFEYSLSRLVFKRQGWLTKQETDLLKDLVGLMKVAKEFDNIISAVEYMILMLEQSRDDKVHFKVLDRLSRDSIPWRWMTARCITKLEHPPEEQSYTILQKLILDRVGRVRAYAAQALGSLGHHDTQTTLRILEDLSYNGPIFGRDVLALSLSELVQVEPERSMKLLTALSVDREPYVRRIVAWSLENIAENAPEGSIKLLDELASDKDWWVRRAAADSLSETMRVDFQKSLEILSRLARDERILVRRAAAHSLTEVAYLRPDKLIETLQDWIKTEDPKLREVVGLALRVIVSRKPDEALSLLEDLAKDQDPDVRRATVSSLSFSLQQDVKGTSALLSLLAKDDDHTVRVEVAYRLDQLHPNDMIKVIELLAQQSMYFSLFEILAFTLKWLMESLKYLLRFSFNDFAKSSEKVLWGSSRFCRINIYSVRENIAKSLQRYTSSNAKQSNEIFQVLAKNQNPKIRKLVAYTLGKPKPQPSNCRDLLERLGKDPITTVRVAAQKSLLRIKYQKNGRKQLVLNGVVGCVLGLIIFFGLQQLEPQRFLSSLPDIGWLSSQNVVDVVLVAVTTLALLGLLRLLEGFGWKQVVVGVAIGGMAIISMWLVQRSVANAAIILILAFLGSIFYYDYRYYFFDSQISNVIGYYAVLVTSAITITLPITLVLRWISTPTYLTLGVLGAACGLAIGILRNLDEKFFWQSFAEALELSLVPGALFSLIFWFIHRPLYVVSLTRFQFPALTGVAHFLFTGSILGLLLVGLAGTFWFLLWGERYRRSILIPSLMGIIVGWGYGILIGHIIFGLLLGFVSGGVFGLLKICLRYKWRDTIRTTALLFVAGTGIGLLGSLLIGHQTTILSYLYAGVFSVYVISVPWQLVSNLLGLGINELDRLD